MNDCLIILCVTVLTKCISNNIQPVIIAENSNLSCDIYLIVILACFLLLHCELVNSVQ